MTLPPTERSRSWRDYRWLVGAFVGVNAIVIILGALAPEGRITGPAGSSFVTTDTGTSALAGTLERLGITVERSQTRIGSTTLDAASTLMLIDVVAGDYESSELGAIESFLERGGRLFVVGDASVAERLVDDAPSWRSAGSSRGEVVAALPLTNQPGPVPLGSFGSIVLDDTDTDSALLVSDDVVIGAIRSVGAGEIVWLADPEPAYNRGIDGPDAAEFVIGIAGSAGPVVFDEFRHGYGVDSGLWTAMTPGWRLAIMLGAATALLALLSYGHREDPAEDLHRRLAPGRDRYLVSVGSLLERANAADEALRLIRSEGIRLLDEAGFTELDAAARARGLTDPEMNALLGDDIDLATLKEADRALARLSRDRP